MKRGFTIVELLVVVAIIGVLLGIVTAVATSSLKNTRERRGDAMASAFQQAIAAYYAQEGEWPNGIENIAKSYSKDKSSYTLTASEAEPVFREIVENSVGANATRPLIDASALFVAKASLVKGDGCNDNHDDKNKTSYCGDKRCVNGVDFTEALKSGMSVSEMAFGWQGREYGKFRRFWITYNAKTDTVKVSKTR